MLVIIDISGRFDIMIVYLFAIGKIKEEEDGKMKKLLALLLTTTMLLSLCACGAPSKPKELEDISDEDWEAAAEALEDMYEEEPVVETEAAAKIYELGETIVTADGMFELSIDSFSFIDFYNSNTLLAERREYGNFDAPEGKTYLLCEGTMRYVGESKEGLQHQLFEEKLDYNDGYTFSSATQIYMFEPNTPVVLGDPDTYGTMVAIHIEPLTGTRTKDVRCIFEVPEVVETDTESPLLLTLSIVTWGKETGYENRAEVTVRFR